MPLGWQVGETLSTQVTGFFNTFNDLIDFDDESFTNVNRNKVETQGLEFELLWQPQAALTVRSQATYTDIEIIDEDSRLTGRPEWTAGVSASWQVRERLSSTADYRYVGKQWATSRDTGEAITERLGDYHEIDLVVRWQAAAHWELSFMLDNVLDEDYESAVGFPGAGRAARLGLRYTRR